MCHVIRWVALTDNQSNKHYGIAELNTYILVILFSNVKVRICDVDHLIVWQCFQKGVTLLVIYLKRVISVMPIIYIYQPFRSITIVVHRKVRDIL